MKAKDYLGVEEDENAPMLEESVNPARSVSYKLYFNIVHTE